MGAFCCGGVAVGVCWEENLLKETGRAT